MTELPKDPGFQVPERYFDALPTRIMQRTAYAAAPKPSAVSRFWQLKTALASVSLGAVFAVAFLATEYLSPEPSAQDVMAQVSQKEIYQYLTTQVDLETADLADVPAVKPRQSLEFLDVRQTDIVNEEHTNELLEEAYEYR
ncbi:hypothetical protein EFA69_14120 [Rufibacter immobilis]|uniref:Uncharacterized protein n=2 Tax=Rufibacter immobilis TaxID=1348778 RepID=A0A3M9MP45_9BACT|nr:hypothetical protein EFA69_14120 [Rufibacter immobilis]